MFAFLEDVDWGFRARLAGYGARYEPRAVGYHRGGATLGDIKRVSRSITSAATSFGS